MRKEQEFKYIKDMNLGMKHSSYDTNGGGQFVRSMFSSNRHCKSYNKS